MAAWRQADVERARGSRAGGRCRVVPGIGMTCGARASSHASASWPMVHPCSRATAAYGVEQLEVLLPVAGLEARHVQPDVLRRQRRDVAQLAGEESAREWAERDERDAQLAARVEHGHFGVARPQRVFGLDGGQRVHGVRTADGCRRHLAHADRPHLAGLDQTRHRADALFDRQALVPAVQVVEVDDVGLEPRQAVVARSARSPRAARRSRAAPGRCGTCRTCWRARTPSAARSARCRSASRWRRSRRAPRSRRACSRRRARRAAPRPRLRATAACRRRATGSCTRSRARRRRRDRAFCVCMRAFRGERRAWASRRARPRLRRRASRRPDRAGPGRPVFTVKPTFDCR